MCDTEIHKMKPIRQVVQVPSGVASIPMIDQTLLQVVTSTQDVVLVEDTSDDEETVLDIQLTIQYPIFLITIEDDTSHSMPEVKENEPPLVEYPIVKATSSLSTIARNGECNRTDQLYEIK